MLITRNDSDAEAARGPTAAEIESQRQRQLDGIVKFRRLFAESDDGGAGRGEDVCGSIHVTWVPLFR
jgi:hypothetical protein